MVFLKLQKYNEDIKAIVELCLPINKITAIYANEEDFTGNVEVRIHHEQSIFNNVMSRCLYLDIIKFLEEQQ